MRSSSFSQTAIARWSARLLILVLTSTTSTTSILKTISDQKEWREGKEFLLPYPRNVSGRASNNIAAIAVVVVSGTTNCVSCNRVFLFFVLRTLPRQR